jgi:hypothetical protein
MIFGIVGCRMFVGIVVGYRIMFGISRVYDVESY